MQADPPIRRWLWIGACACAVYALANTAVNPIVLDEVLVPGEIIAGSVRYAPGHPHEAFYPRAFCVWNYIAAASISVAGDALVQSAIRNIATLFAAMFVPYALALVLTRSPVWAALAVAINACETIIQFKGSYPVSVFPIVHSHGQLGQLLAVFAVTAWIAGWPRVAGLLTGVFPMVHGGMLMPLVAWCVAYLALSRSRPRGVLLRRALVWTGIGVGLCAVFGLLIWLRTHDLRVAAPYLVEGDSQAISRNFLEFTDGHRRVPRWSTFGFGFHLLAFAGLGALVLYQHARAREDGPANGSAARWTALFGVAVWSVVVACAVLQSVGWLPRAVIMSMPARLTNLSVLLLAPLTVTALARASASLSERTQSAVLAVCAALVAGAAVWWNLWVVAVRYHFLFFLWGILAGVIVWRERGRGRLVATTLIVLLAMGALLHFVFPHMGRQWSLGAGFIAALAACAIGGRIQLQRVGLASAALVIACAALLASVLPGRIYAYDRAFRFDLLSDFDRELQSWLARETSADEPILTPTWERAELQQKTAHPVLFETETLWLMAYMPSLGAVVNQMTTDLFGVDYSDRAVLSARQVARAYQLVDPIWRESWMRRTRSEWQALSRKYSFRLVLAPADTPLDLPVALTGSLWNLHVIP